MYKKPIDGTIKILKGKKFDDLQKDDTVAVNLYKLSISYYKYGEALRNSHADKKEYESKYNLSLISFELLIQASNPRRLNDAAIIDKNEILRLLENLIENKFMFSSEILLRAHYCIGLIYNNTNTKDYAIFYNDDYRKNCNKSIEHYQEYLRLLQITDSETINKIKFTTLKVCHFKSKSFEQLQDYHEAINCILTQLLFMQKEGYGPGSFIVYFNLGHYYHKIDKNNDAISYLNKAIMYLNVKYDNDHLIEYPHIKDFEYPLISTTPETVDYDYNDTLLLIALCFKKLGQFEKAEKINKKIITLYQNSQNNSDKELLFRAKNNQAMIYAERNQTDEALREISFVDNFDGNYMNPTHLDTKGYIFYKKEKYSEALKWFEKAIKEDPSDKEFWFHKANCYLRLDEHNNAISCYDNARQRNQEFVEAINNRAVAHYKNNDKERAIKDLKEILKIKYDDIMAHHNLLLLSTNETSQTDFLKYWQNTKSKRVISTALISTIIIISLILFIPPLILDTINNNPYNTTNTTEIKDTSKVTKNTSISNTKTKAISKTPYYNNQHLITGYIALLIIIITILLSPIIKTAKLSTTSIELTIVDSGPNKKTELEYID